MHAGSVSANRSDRKLGDAADMVSMGARASSAELCEYVTDLRLSSIPLDVVERVKLLLLDNLGCILLGSSERRLRKVVGLARRQAGLGSVRVAGTRVECDAGTAAFAMACMAQAHDYNDGHSVSGYHGGSYHPGRVVVPTALAEAQSLGQSGQELLVSLVVGYDVATRVRGRKDRRPLSDAYASAAVSARLRGFGNEEVGRSMGLAGFLAAGQQLPGRADAYLRNGFRARSGIDAALMVAEGFGAPAIVDDPELSTRFLRHGLGQQFEVMNVYIKPYPTCRMTHGPIEAALELRTGINEPLQSVSSVEILQLPRGMYVARRRPDAKLSTVHAEFNLYYVVAVALIDGRVGLAQFRPARIRRSDVQTLSERITVRPCKEFSTGYPGSSRASSMTIVLGDGSVLNHRVDLPRGEGCTFMATDEVIGKFERNARRAVDSARIPAIVDAVLGVEQCSDVQELIALLM